MKIVQLEARRARLKHGFRGRLRLLGEYRQNDHGISIEPVHDAPRRVGIWNPEFAAPWSERWHRSRVRQAQLVTALEAPQ
jgi:hypothetical protein